MTRPHIFLLLMLMLSSCSDGRYTPSEAADSQNAEVPAMCEWSQSECERLKEDERFKMNCDSHGGSVYSCHESCADPDSYQCRYDFCLGYREQCLPTTTTTEAPPTDAGAKPRMCYWTKEQCQNGQTDPDYSINCDQMNLMHNNIIYSCYEHCKAESNWCQNDYCTNYTKHCLKATMSTTIPPSTLPTPTPTSTSTPAPTIDTVVPSVPRQCHWLDEHCDRFQDHEDFKNNCDRMTDSPGSKPYSCQKWCEHDGPLCSHGQCADYKHICFGEEEMVERLNIKPVANHTHEDVMLGFILICVISLLLWKAVKHFRRTRQTQQGHVPQAAADKKSSTNILSRCFRSRRARISVGAHFDGKGVEFSKIPQHDNQDTVADDKPMDTSKSLPPQETQRQTSYAAAEDETMDTAKLLPPQKIQRQTSRTDSENFEENGSLESRLRRIEQMMESTAQTVKYLKPFIETKDRIRRTSSARPAELKDNEKKEKSRLVGGYKIFEDDWKSLESGKLTDAMVVALVHKMVKEHEPDNCKVQITSFLEETLGEWQSKDIVFWLRKKDMNSNNNFYHFYLVIVEVKAKKMHICDSLPGEVDAEAEKQELVKCEQGLQRFSASSAQLTTDKQKDGESCGLYVVMSVEKYLVAVKESRYRPGHGDHHLEFKTNGGSTEPFTYRKQLIDLIESKNN